MQSGEPDCILLCAAEDPVSEAGEVADTKRDSFKDLGLIIAALSETIGPRETNGIENLRRPIMISLDAGIKLFDIIVFSEKDPISEEFWSPTGLSSHNDQEVVF